MTSSFGNALIHVEILGRGEPIDLPACHLAAFYHHTWININTSYIRDEADVKPVAWSTAFSLVWH